jgi:hypothetical protein
MSGIDETLSTAHLDDALCADLVLRLTPPGEREAALLHAASCRECEARLRAHASAADRASSEWLARRAAGAEAAHAASRGEPVVHVPAGVWTPEAQRTSERVLPDIASHLRAAKRRPPVWRDARVLTVAAAALFLFAVAWPLIARGPWISRPTWLPAAGEVVRTREGETEDPRIAAGLAAYERRDLETAERELSAARASGATDLLRRLYLGHVRLERGDPHGAVEMLNALPWKLVPEPWRREGVRVLARALRQDGDAARADSIERALRQSDVSAPFVP